MIYIKFCIRLPKPNTYSKADVATIFNKKCIEIIGFVIFLTLELLKTSINRTAVKSPVVYIYETQLLEPKHQYPNFCTSFSDSKLSEFLFSTGLSAVNIQ